MVGDLKRISKEKKERKKEKVFECGINSHVWCL